GGRRAGAGAITPSGSDELSWVDGFPCHQHLVVEMRRRAVAGVAGEPDALIELDALSGDHVDAREMAVAALDATPVIQRDDVAVAPGAADRAHDTGCGGLHGSAGRRRQIDAGVEFRLAGPRRATQAGPRIDRRRPRPPPGEPGEAG